MVAHSAPRAILALLVAFSGLVLSSAAPASAAPTTCGGVVFQDYDADGERIEDYSYISSEYAAVPDAGVADLTVTVTDAQGDVFTATTSATGEWSVAIDTNDFPIRVDITGYPSTWSPGPVGPDSGSLNQFITNPADCTGPFDGLGQAGNASVSAPGSFCENRPDFVTSCYLFGDVVDHDNQAAIVSLVDGAVDDLSTASTDWRVDEYTPLATLGEVGTVYGTDIRPQDGSIYAASFVKRHTQLGPTDNPTTIYRVGPAGTAPWFTVDAAATDPHSGATDGWQLDADAFAAVGREGLGDLEITPDGNTLYTVDLGNRQLVMIPINADGSANTAGVVRTDITAASLGVAGTCAAGDVRPFGLGFSQDGDLLVGAVCSAESTVSAADYPADEINGPHLGDKSQLDAWVFTFSGGTFSNRIDVPLPTTGRGSQNGGAAAPNTYRGESDWRPWVTQAPFQANFTGWPGGGVTYAQPILSDIEVDGDDLVIGFMDLWGHQAGSNANLPNYDGGNGGNVYRIDQPLSSGDSVRAVANGSGGYNFPTVGPDFFYFGDNYPTTHQETHLGSSAQIPGRPYTVFNVFDPVEAPNTWQSGGLEWMDNSGLGSLTPGQHVRGYRLYDGNDGSFPDGTPTAEGTFEKAAGIGDLAATCGIAPIEIGNRVWLDLDADGVQDPEELALEGVVVQLLAADGVTVIATTTTNAAGEYIFTQADGVDFNTDYIIDFDVSTTTSTLPGGLVPADLVETIPDAATGASADGIDSDVVNDQIAITTGGPGENDHTFDAGYTPAYDLALTKVYTSDDFGNTTDGIVEAGSNVTFTITVTNQGAVDAAAVEVTDYIPSGFTLNDPNWTDNGDGTATRSIGPVLQTAPTVVTIVLIADGTPGDKINLAEISSDDGNDIDSEPDTDPADDNQPAAPGDATDDVTDNSTGPGGPDSDDHDIAGVTIVNYDLALTKVYTSDTFGNTTDGVVENGSDVVFTIEVTNQGTVAATTFEVTDYLPAGFVLNDAAWTDNGDGTATIAAGPLAAGASTTLTITLTADSAAPGDLVNWAEISSDDGNDVDSTTDATQGNDNQPAAPGDATDDVIDNSAGPGGADEDDHDPAPITVANYDLALTKAYTSDDFGNTTDGVIANGSNVTFTIEVTNQGTIDATTFAVTDYLPAGFVLNDAAWTDNGDGTATIAGGPLAAGAATTFTITLTADSAADGDLVNWAEISADDGNDADSTPDTTVGNDNQPAAPGDATDDVIDNSAGPGGADEDDHDPAPITVSSYDLALTKVYTSDTFGNTTDGVVENGSDVVFTIEVTNQGTIDATTFEVTDYLPAGFTLNDAAWTDNGDGTATIAGGPLAAGATTDFTITLTADAASAGDAVNWAEISADDGADIDSTTDATQGNDNQPAAPGDPTDDVIDNSAGPGGADEDDHDPALVSVSAYDLALTKVYTSDTYDSTTDGVVANGFDAVFTIEVTNQGTVGATSFEVTDYLPAGFVLNDAAWTDNGDGTATTAGGPLAAGASTTLTITLTADSAAPGDLVNWAEISSDDGNDVDSTPDVTIGNDNQPAAPGDATDDVIDNSAGPGGADEDDHDPAPITVANYDLALTKVYTSDDFGNTTDGLIQNGSNVTFTIEVTNQGTIDATTFAVTDYLPAGFVLNDAAWTDNGDGTATIAGGPLAAGAATTFTITLTADSAALGESVNWAEISSDDGVDVDSTTDATQGNDNQPAAPGDATDDVIDNSAGPGGADEDDHDPAPVTVGNYDLALTKVYTSDDFGNTTDGVIENGSNVTFTIEVTNQGTLDATTFAVTDYLPAGFVLNDAAWTDNGDGTATIAGGPLAAGAATTFTITLTADSAADGDLVNWAEISADDGTDVDSSPDADRLNDNQPLAPGDGTDDVIDNSAGPGGADEDDHDPAPVTVQSYDLALTKVYTSDDFGNTSDGVIENGSDVVFTIEVTNQGSVDATTFEVTDYLPAGFILNDAAWTDNGDGTATIAAGPLAAGAATTFTITLTADSAAPGDLVNWAEISADDGNDVDSTTDATQGNDNQPAAPGDATDDVIDNSAGPGGADEDDHDPAPITVANYDLALTKAYTSDDFGDTTDGLVDVGSNVTFTIEVTNQGTLDATTFEVTDYLPAGFILNDAAWTDNGDGTATIAGGPLAAGAATTFTITLTADSPSAGDAVNWAEISADDGNDLDSTPDATQGNDNQPAAPGDATDDVIDNSAGPGGADEDDHDPALVSVAAYDLALTKAYTSDDFGNTTDGLIENGSNVTFTIEVTNQGTIDATTFAVTDYLPAGFVLNDAAWTDNGDGTATIAGGPLAAGAATTFTITLTADSAADGDLVNWAEISADDGADIDSTPDANQADDNQPAAPGDATDDVIDNSTGPGGPDSDDHDPAPITVGSYDLALTKVFTSDDFGSTTDGVIENGSDVVFTIEVTNQGTIDAATFEVTDYLPAGFILNDAAWTDNGDGTATIAGGPLAAGAATTFTITLTADSAADGVAVNWAEISADDGNDVDSTTDATQGNDNQPAAPGDATDDVIDNSAGPGGADEDDHDPAPVTVQTYDLALTKVYTSDTFGSTTDGVVENGSDVVFTITVTNQGSVDATTFDVTDYLPAGFTLNDAAWTDNGDDTATISAGPLAAGASVDITITLTATSATAGGQVNWAEISADDGNDVDSIPDTNQADDNQPAAPGDATDDVIDNSAGPGGADSDDHDPAPINVVTYDLALTKAYTSDTFGPTTDGLVENGSDVTFTIEVTNQGTLDATTFEVTDYLPAGFILNDAAWTDNGDGTATIAGGPLAAGAATTFTITLTADSAADGNLVNWAEISADDGNDVDSTTDATQGNDNQPAAPGDATDDVIDNSAGPGGADEDDHDPAPIAIGSYDLALTKAYTSDTHNVANDAIIEPGADVVFTITVTNQGTIDAATFDVTDYFPAGFTLNDAAWTDNGDDTATISAGPLAAGASVDLTITLTAGSIAAGDYVNWAEISSDDGNDADSTPDATQGNDNQPAAPGDATDDVIDNSTGPGGADEDDHDPAGVSVEVYDLALTKAYTSDTFGAPNDAVIEPGADVTFTITVTNQGTVDALTFEVTDYLPAGFTLNDAAWTDNGDGTATIAGGPLAAGATTDITITTTAGALTPGSYVNWAEISADDGNDADSTTDTTQGNDNQPSSPGDPTDGVIDNSDGPGGPDEDDHDPAVVGVDNYDLALTKVYTSDDFGDTTDGLVQNGSDVVFTITVVNQGTIDATTFEVTDYLPAGFVLNDSAWTDNLDGTATIAGGPLAAGASTNVTITLTADSAVDGDLVNWAEISTDDGTDIDSTPDATQGNDNQPAAPGDPTDDATNNAAGPGGADEDDHDPAPISVGSYDLALTKVYTSDTAGAPTDGVVEPGADVVFTITVTNQGTIDAATFAVTDYLPAGFVLNDAAWTDNGDGTATIAGGPLAAGASVDITITLTADAVAAGDVVNWAEISSDDGDDIDSTPDADQADDNQPAAPGDATDDVIDNSAGPGGADSDDHDPAGLTVEVFDLALTKVYTSDTSADGNATDGVLQIGDDVTFTIDVTNQGSVDSATFTITDTPPAGFTLNDAAWADNGDGTASFTGGPLAAGATVSVPITFTVASSGAGELVNLAEISADDGNDADSTTDSDATNDNQPAAPGDPTDDVTDNSTGPGGEDEDDHDIAGVTVDAYDLALIKQYVSDTSADGNSTDGQIAAGDDVVFSITVLNQGTADAANIVITDTFPAGFSLNDPAWTDNGDGTAQQTIAAIPAGGQVVLTITLTADGASIGSTVNIAEITADDGTDIDSTPTVDPADDGTPVDDVVDNTGGDEDDHDPAPITVVPDYDLALIKMLDGTATTLPVVNGQTVSFTITVINQGSTPAQDITVIDYVDLSMWNGFSVADNAAGTTGGDVSLPYVWSAAGTDGSVSLTGVLAGGESVTIPVTLTIAAGADLSSLLNVAEISSATPINPDGTPMTGVTDTDSTPDTTNDDTVVDDVTDNTGGDEDDHDVAGVTPPTYSIGNQVWFDENNNGLIDAGETGIGGVTVALFSDADGDGQADDVNGDGVITTADAVGTTTTDGDGLYLFDDLASGDYVVGIPGSEWNADGPLYGTLSSDPTAADPDGNIDSDDDGTPSGGFVFSGGVTLGDGEPTGENPDNDPTTADVNENLTVDFGFWRPIFDLALRKQLENGSNSGEVNVGDSVTFTLTVFNQGSYPVTDIRVIDYVPTGLTLADPDWTATTGGATTSLPGTLAPGAAISVDITFVVNPNAPATIRNNAEIISGNAVASDGGVIVMPNGLPIPDLDSTPDASDSETPLDDVLDNSGGDEDDHDTAVLSVSQRTTTSTIAFTGASTGTILMIGLLLLLAGGALLGFGRRRNADTAV